MTDVPTTPRIALLGVPIEIGASQAGTLMGPAALRTAGIARLLEQMGISVEDHGDLAIQGVTSEGTAPANAKFYDEVKTWIRALSERAFWLASSGAVPIFMGGDHSLVDGVGERRGALLAAEGPAAFRAVARCPCRLQHAGDDGHRQHAWHVGGVPVRRARARWPARRAAARFDRAATSSICSASARSIRSRRSWSATAASPIADMRAIDEFGVGVLIRRVIERVKARNGVLHVSFDVDFLDPAVAPGVGTTVPGGATYREAHLIMELLHDSGLVRSVDIVELNPFLDERGRTARVAVELIGSLFGQQITDRPTPSNAVLPD